MEPLLEKQQTILLTIKRLGINGEGIGYYKRKAVFVPGAIPPEEVIVRITKVSDKYAEGEIVKFNIKAAKRVKPFCKHYYQCGGCQLQHVAYDEQLLLKEEMLQQAIERYSNVDVASITFNDMVGMNTPRHYRHKAQMPVENTKHGITTGLYKVNSNDLVPIIDCPVQAEHINLVNQRILEICDTHSIYAFDPKTMRGLLRYIVTRESHHTGEIQVTLIITIFNKALHQVAQDILQLPNVVSVGISKNHDVKNIEIFGEDVEILAGKNTIAEGIGDIQYDLKPKAFYQLNPSQAIQLYSYVKSLLDFDTDQTIIDAYSGAGAISMYLAPYAKRVIGIDSSKESIYSALHNRKINKFDNVDFINGEVKTALPKLYDKGITPDVIIIDPPRSGLDNKTLDLLTRKPVSKVIYVSCNPSTLGKNLKVLTRKYKVLSVTPFDMFPHTSHIESVTLLVKK
ncbi:23S rRNA (uracil(1939)-C(5))-methyltransferase RlmD [Candidatus Xianfuyuplasma coldseepsis]|uniref:23S rRNA (Uracil(1939)-C(5))-methyltransferase RlmD n=1 Tax=Candidatus Xianfuyuplasma coldseepsis TaxID=2782163 RepID=A0A7L7KPM5_9MOLU|nr:23S rRNA (uracil(1939)-C(5))-methyltransferase RlmD [Xianfuyuplasma coldseepsis]QMS84740.1 23S rRNA (uracil(1939)-C(5))-methyltransferase RlmD [Xianfuyuplasma coldseepsis]